MYGTDTKQTLERIQDALERTYEIATPLRAADFVLSDPTVHARLRGRSDRTPPEEVLVHCSDAGLELSLWLAPELLTRVRTRHLAPGDFTLVLEGISHFLCLVWNAGHDRPVTAVGLELQAEIDKLLGLMLFQGTPAQPPRELHGWLYSRASFPADLTRAERTRYRTANCLAARYWRELLERHPGGTSDPRLTRELRRFYRLPCAAKLARIARR